MIIAKLTGRTNKGKSDVQGSRNGLIQMTRAVTNFSKVIAVAFLTAKYTGKDIERRCGRMIAQSLELNKIYNTMIYQKQNYVPLTHNRYEQEFEYMFVFSKGKPKTFNPIMIPCKYAGTETWGSVTFHKTNNSGLVSCGKKKVNDFKQHGNIFCYLTGKVKSTNGIKHPAPFPEQLANDHIISWSNEGDTILDCFMGSGTTAKMAKMLGRSYIGFEISKEYCEIAEQRIAEVKGGAEK